MPNLYTLFNHTLTKLQIEDAKKTLNIKEIIEPSNRVKNIWCDISPELESIEELLSPIFNYILEMKKGDFVLIQGDFGAVVIAVEWAKAIGAIPIYSTTERNHKEILKDDGSVEMVKSFRHCIFRRY